MNLILKAENIFYSVENNSLLSKGNKKIILEDISFELIRGKILGIAGESGSGKTTLAKILVGIIKPTGGNINFYKSTELEKVKTSPVQILFQNTGDILNPFREVDKIVEEALQIRNGNRLKIKEEKERIFKSLEFPDHLWKRKGYELSGGEQQRAALARILAAKPELLILDEPLSAQDPESQLNLLNLFKRINNDFNLTMICIAHNLKILRKLTHEVIILYKGKIAEKGETNKIFNSPEHPYTKFLLKAENYDLSYEELKAIPFH